MELCPLCHKTGEAFYKNIFYICKECFGIFRSKKDYPAPEKEKARYELHQNDVNDAGYKQFVSPITTTVFNSFTPENIGLDFGAGPGSVISKILRDRRYNIKLYDPFFHNFPELLNEKYDYIVCCEVIEHFHNPDKEFRLLKKLLKPLGCLYCMTHIYNMEMDFKKWYYKNDFTHVYIYQEQTLEWIKMKYGFSEMKIDNRMIAYIN
jgi:SAM-dependent methyltransferase